MRQAEPGDLDAVLSVLDEAVAWLHSIGVTEQWLGPFSSEEAWVSIYRSAIESGHVFVARNDDGIVGTFRLYESGWLPFDEQIWSDVGLDGAAYLHTLAVRRSVAGAGIAAQMLDWAAKVAAARGLKELRLDCWAGNERLRRYYLEAGFQWRGDVPQTQDGRDFSASRFARPV
jgi:GNAT superfamily N-acetyltransferase